MDSKHHDPANIRYDIQILQSLRRIIRVIEVQSKKLKANHNITTPQLLCLDAIQDHGPLTATDLAKEVHLSTSTIVGIIDRMEAADLIQRTRSKSDRRVIFIQVTPQGTEIMKRVPSPFQTGFTAALNELAVHERAAISAALLKIVNLMEAEHLEAAPILETGMIIPVDPETRETRPKRN